VPQQVAAGRAWPYAGDEFVVLGFHAVS